MNVLFVCTGNVSRSFLAERLLRQELETLKVQDVAVSSAGLFAPAGSPPDPNMVTYLLNLGTAVGRHEARQIRTEDVAWADLILVMEKVQEGMIKRKWPEAKDKVEHLGRYVSMEPAADDIVDPFGQSPYFYRLAQSQITLAVKSLARKLTEKRREDPHAEDSNHRG